MYRQATTPAMRLGASTKWHRMIVPEIDAAKAQTAHWEPALQLASDKSSHDFVEEGQDDTAWMTTFSASDPGSPRPLLMSSVSLPHPQPTLPTMFPPTPTQPMAAVPIQKLITDIAKPIKPWPYSLPKALQPKTGTTYQLMHSPGLTAMDEAVSKRVGIVQAMLYGVPEPKRFSYVGSGGFVYKVLYGVKDAEDIVAKDTVVVKTGSEAEQAVVEKVKVEMKQMARRKATS